MKAFIVFIIGLLSWLSSYMVNIAYDTMVWQCLVSLVLVDLLFIFIFNFSSMNHIKRRWVLNLLLISITVTAGSSFLIAVGQAGFIYSDFFLLVAFEGYYQSFSMIISALILVVLGSPQRIIGAFDANYWPRSSSGVPYDCFADSLYNSEGGEQ